jgi:hypothetical protein
MRLNHSSMVDLAISSAQAALQLVLVAVARASFLNSTKWLPAEVLSDMTMAFDNKRWGEKEKQWSEGAKERRGVPVARWHNSGVGGDCLRRSKRIFIHSDEQQSNCRPLGLGRHGWYVTEYRRIVSDGGV